MSAYLADFGRDATLGPGEAPPALNRRPLVINPDRRGLGLLALFLVDRVRLAAAAALRLGLHFTPRWLAFWRGL